MAAANPSSSLILHPSFFILVSRAPVVLLAFAAACGPHTAVRRTAFVPGVFGPTAAGRPLERGEWKLSGGLDSAELGEQIIAYPHEDEPGVAMPRAQLTGNAWVGVTRFLEVGLQFRYAPYEWSRPGAIGVLDIPGCCGPVYSFTGGTGVRTSFHFGELPMWLSLSTELNFSHVSQAVFVRCPGCASDEPHNYTLDRVEDATAFTPNLFLHFGGDVGKHVHLSVFAGVETGVRNNGFDPDIRNRDASTLESYPVWVLGTGAQFRLGKIVLDANLVLPASEERTIRFGPGLMLQAGLVL